MENTIESAYKYMQTFDFKRAVITHIRPEGLVIPVHTYTFIVDLEDMSIVAADPQNRNEWSTFGRAFWTHPRRVVNTIKRAKEAKEDQQ
ncbi:MAG: hypothetical protein GY847_36735 [Proteobacteria bacterium]|nr:hypothetical protein [Pseudomonadota bacterium]